jgi:hypothetical protein
MSVTGEIAVTVFFIIFYKSFFTWTFSDTKLLERGLAQKLWLSEDGIVYQRRLIPFLSGENRIQQETL